MIPLARSDRGVLPAQSYRDHVRGVIKKVIENLMHISPYIGGERTILYKYILELAAEYHDLGKLAPENQDVLAGIKTSQALPIKHRDAGVKYLLGDFRECPQATLVYAHHRPGLPDFSRERGYGKPFRIPEAAEDSDKNLEKYLQTHEQELGIISRVTEPKTTKLPALAYRILLSCLVDADYSDAGGEEMKSPELRWEERRLQLERYVDGLPNQTTEQDSERDRLRRLLYDYCKAAPTQAAIEYCDSPVGTGKTTAIMAHMLKVAQAYELRHIFVVLPYTNIITQTVKVLRQALVLEGENPEAVVAEHHHQADFAEIELRQLAVTWKAPIIVTTAVQFFETLAGNIPARLRKLHQLPGSAIIFDEYHAALPTKLMPSAWEWMKELVSQWGCRICMASATTVKFWESAAFNSKSSKSRLVAEPLLSMEISAQLNRSEQARVRLNAWEGLIPHFSSAEQLASQVEKYHGSKIVVLNTVESAAVFAAYLRKQEFDVLHLSSALSPGDKERTIDEIKRRLDPATEYRGDWILVATSCVECGLNFSFRYGFCELRSLSAYLQLSGRVRRNCEADYEDATLIVFTIVDDSFVPHPGMDDSRDVFRKMIYSGRLPDISVTEAVTEAFQDECKLGGSVSQEISKAERNRDFATVAQKFRVIEEETVTVVADQKLAVRIRAGERVSVHELQRGSVNLRKSIFKRLGLIEDELPMLAESHYDDFLGYMKSLV